MSLYWPPKSDSLAPQIEQLRRENALVETKQVLRDIMFKITPLYLLFWVSDLFYSYEDRYLFLAYRIFVIPFAYYAYIASKHAKDLVKAQVPAILYAFVASGIITLMALQTKGTSSPYYAGINLVCIISITFIPWSSIKQMALTMALIYGPITIAALFMTTAANFNGTVVSFFFMGCTLFISIVIRYFQDKLRYKEIKSALLLQNEIENRDQIIAQKTEKVNNLNKQLLKIVHETAAGISHELSQPLTAVMGLLAIISRHGPEDQSLNTKLKIIYDHLNKVNTCIHHLQNITRYETQDYAGGQVVMDLKKSAEAPPYIE